MGSILSINQINIGIKEISDIRCINISPTNKILYCAGVLFFESSRKSCPVIIWKIQKNKLLSKKCH